MIVRFDAVRVLLYTRGFEAESVRGKNLGDLSRSQLSVLQHHKLGPKAHADRSINGSMSQ